MKRFIFFCSLIIAWSIAEAASFDCTKATSGTEKLICSDKGLSEQDEMLSMAYRERLKTDSDKVAVKRRQIEWLKSERDLCVNVACIQKAFDKRFEELSMRTQRNSDGSPVGYETDPDTVFALASQKANRTQSVAGGESSVPAPVQAPVRPPYEGGASSAPGTPAMEAPVVPTANAAVMAGPVSSGAAPTAQAAAKPADAIAAGAAPAEDRRTGVVGEIVRTFSLVLLLATVVLLVKPGLLSRWMTAPSRKAIAVSGFVAIGLATALVNATKGADERAQDVARQHEIDAKRDREQLAVQQAKAAKSPQLPGKAAAPDQALIKDMCLKGGIYAMAYMDARHKSQDMTGLKQNLADALADYPTNVQPLANRMWNKMFDMVDNGTAVRNFGTDPGTVGLKLGLVCKLAMQKDGLLP